ncbi:phosphotransferase family protein [Actinoplanes sp. CA-030573]|uniref:phosphotransferase family protein n=1 Tax=Actinoplanes sp. CA-030573 TaxID=3239898 RepID=UPI003D904171
MTNAGELEPSLRSWVDEVALPGRKVVAARELTGGYSNHNILITTAEGDSYVLRRYLGSNKSAVEAALMRRLAGVVPVPVVVAAGDVMLYEFVPGYPVGELMSSLDEVGVAELGRSVGETLAAIGSVEFEAPGFFADETLTPGPPAAEPTAGLDQFVARCLEEGNAAGHLSHDEQRALLRFAGSVTPALGVLAGSRRLVHADYNPKNLLAARRDDRWQVVAALDWEFAFSSAPLFDVGNMLRDPRPAGFEEAFLAGFRAGGGDLPDDWRRLSRALDLYSLADFLTRPAGHRYFAKSIERIRALLREPA